MTHYCYPQTSNLKSQNWLLKHSLNSTLTFFFLDGRPKNFYSKTETKANNSYISILRFCSRRITSAKIEGAEPKTKIPARQFLRDHFARTWAALFKSLGTQLYFTLCERAFNLNISEIIVEIIQGTWESSSCSASMHTFESLSINAWLMLWLITCWEAQLIASASAWTGTLVSTRLVWAKTNSPLQSLVTIAVKDLSDPTAAPQWHCSKQERPN